jgi:hypothetical protein
VLLFCQLSVAAPAKQVLVDDDNDNNDDEVVVVVAVVERVPEIRANKCQLRRSMFPLVRLAETGGLGMKGFTLIRIINSRRRSRNAPSATFLVGRTPAESSSSSWSYFDSSSSWSCVKSLALMFSLLEDLPDCSCCCSC